MSPYKSIYTLHTMIQHDHYLITFIAHTLSITHYLHDNRSQEQLLGSIVVSIPACHAGDRGSIPRRGGVLFC